MHLVAVGDVHDAVIDQRRRLQVRRSFYPVHPFRHERAGVAAVDLSEGTVPPALVIARIREPIVSRTVAEIVVGDLRSQSRYQCKADQCEFSFSSLAPSHPRHSPVAWRTHALAAQNAIRFEISSGVKRLL